jgi:hypothetical protein
MATGNPEDTVNRLVRVAEKHFAAEEREAAQDLIRDAFMALPDELQEMYYDVVELHRQRKFKESSDLFEEWMDQARELGLI